MLVLVVEDNGLVAFMIEDALRSGSHDVLGPALSVGDALELVAAQLPGLALIDIDLAGTRSGIELAEALARDWHVPSVYMTGQGEAARSAFLPAFGLLEKPVDPKLIVEVAHFVDALWQGTVRDSPGGKFEAFASVDRMSETIATYRAARN